MSIGIFELFCVHTGLAMDIVLKYLQKVKIKVSAERHYSQS